MASGLTRIDQYDEVAVPLFAEVLGPHLGKYLGLDVANAASIPSLTSSWMKKCRTAEIRA